MYWTEGVNFTPRPFAEHDAGAVVSLLQTWKTPTPRLVTLTQFVHGKPEKRRNSPFILRTQKNSARFAATASPAAEALKTKASGKPPGIFPHSFPKA